MSYRPRVALLAPYNLGPYHYARYSALANDGIDLLVVKMPLKEHYRPWATNLPPAQFPILTPFDAERPILRTVLDFLHRERPDVVVSIGYNSKYIWAMSMGCKMLGIPHVLYSVGWNNADVFSVREMLKRLYVSSFFDAAVVTGTRASSYAQRLGIRADKIFEIGNVVDNEHFSASVAAKKWKLPPRYFLTVSRLSPEKNVDGLLRAYLLYLQRGGEWDLCIAGTGSLEDALKRSVPPKFNRKVHWLGWVDYADLPIIYQSTRCFLLASQFEPWGLVVNEAMAAGKPVLVSKRCGCQPELCKEGENGYSFDPDDHEYLASLLQRIESMGVGELEQMGRTSQEIIREYSLVTWRDKFVSAIQQVLRR